MVAIRTTSTVDSNSFNFDQVVERRGSDSNKWCRYGDEVLPLWVADMDFASPPAIQEALHERIHHGVFGYCNDPETLRAVFCERLESFYGWKIEPEHLVFLPGLVCGLNAVTRAIGTPGDGVLVNTPVYQPFLSAPGNHNRELHAGDLRLTRRARGEIYYELDLDALEQAIRPNTRLFLLCNPHNPVGRAYTRQELSDLAELCLRHDLVICSDEIHNELLHGDTTHTPIATLSPEIADRTITLMAPSKTFNIPGLGCSMAIVTNPDLRRSLERAMAGIVPHVNVLGYVAAIAAYRDSTDWMLALRDYLTANRDFAVQFLAERLPQLRYTVPEATYLLWIDCRDAGIPGNPFQFFLEEARVALNEGSGYGEAGTGFVRLNFGCPRATLRQALEQMEEALARIPFA
jgi:cystathionine beta-lyase